MVNRQNLIEKAGNIVILFYKSDEDKKCFALGWFFEMTETHCRLKVTSTKFETYESIEVPIEKITEIKDYERD